MSLVRWLVEKRRIEQCKAEPCIFRKMANDRVSLMVGVHANDIIVSGDSDVCDEVFSELKERFPVDTKGS